MSFKKPWTEVEANRLVGALAPMAVIYSFSAELGSKTVPDPKCPEMITLDFKPIDPKAEDLNPNTAKLICWMRDVWGKPVDNIKSGPFNPFTYHVGIGFSQADAPPLRREPAVVRRPVAALRGGGAGGGAAELIREAARAHVNGWVEAANDVGGGAGAGENVFPPLPPMDFPQPNVPRMVGFNAQGQPVDALNNILIPDGFGNYVYAPPNPANPDQYFGDAPAKKGKESIPSPRFHYVFMRNDSGHISVRVW